MRTLAAVLMLFSAQLWAAGGGATFPNDPAPVDLGDTASLQRGAKYYVNYCLGCHSLAYQRYNRTARDLGLSDQAVLDNLVFDPDAKVGDPMTIAMHSGDGERWFGAAPPDLTVIARARGADYLYNYLRGFYLDESMPLGVNNSVKTVSMPHVLWELEGWKKPVYSEVSGADGKPHQAISGFEQVQPGGLAKDEYDAAVGDLVNFLVYVGEPAQLERQQLGVWVLLFLALTAVLFYLLKKEYWRDVH